MKIEKAESKYYRIVTDAKGVRICGIVQMSNNTWALSDLKENITNGHRFKNPNQALRHLKGQQHDK